MINLVEHALCTLADVKLTMAGDVGAQKDDLFALLINAFSESAQGYADRQFLNTTHTEYFDCGALNGPGGPRRTAQLLSMPVDPDPTLFFLYEDQAGVFDAPTLLVEGTDFVVDRDLGIVSRAGAVGYDTGVAVGSTVRPYFLPGAKTLKAVYPGGLVTPRPAGPAAPTVVVTVAAGLSGTYRYGVATVVDATGVESVVSLTATIQTADTGVDCTFANPGTGKTTRIYRTVDQGRTLYFLAEVSGSSGGPQTYSDASNDLLLDHDRVAREAGPLVVPPDLRLACVMQTSVWQRNAKDFSVQRINQNDVGSSSFFDPTNFLPYVRETLEAYRL